MASTLAQTSPVASQAKRRYEDSPSQRKWRSIPWVVTVTMNWPRLSFSSTQPEASSDSSISASSPSTAGFQSGSFTARARVARRSSFDTPKYRHEFQSDNKNLAIWPTRPHSSGDNERPWAVVPMDGARNSRPPRPSRPGLSNSCPLRFRHRHSCCCQRHRRAHRVAYRQTACHCRARRRSCRLSVHRKEGRRRLRHRSP